MEVKAEPLLLSIGMGNGDYRTIIDLSYRDIVALKAMEVIGVDRLLTNYGTDICWEIADQFAAARNARRVKPEKELAED